LHHRRRFHVEQRQGDRGIVSVPEREVATSLVLLWSPRLPGPFTITEDSRAWQS